MLALCRRSPTTGWTLTGMAQLTTTATRFNGVRVSCSCTLTAQALQSVLSSSMAYCRELLDLLLNVLSPHIVEHDCTLGTSSSGCCCCAPTPPTVLTSARVRTAGCPQMNRLAIDRFRFGLQWCLAKAVDLGLDIAITPHLDDGLERGKRLHLPCTTSMCDRCSLHLAIACLLLPASSSAVHECLIPLMTIMFEDASPAATIAGPFPDSPCRHILQVAGAMPWSLTPLSSMVASHTTTSCFVPLPKH